MTHPKNNKIPGIDGDGGIDLSELETAVLLAPLEGVPSVQRRELRRRKPKKRRTIAAGASVAIVLGGAAAVFFTHDTVKPTPAVAAVVKGASAAVSPKEGSILHMKVRSTWTKRGKTLPVNIETWGTKKQGRVVFAIGGARYEMDGRSFYNGKRIFQTKSSRKSDFVAPGDFESLFDIKAEINDLRNGRKELEAVELDGRSAYKIVKKDGKSTTTFWIDTETFAPVQVDERGRDGRMTGKIEIERLRPTKDSLKTLSVRTAHPQTPVVRSDQRYVAAIMRMSKKLK